jgi:serralysin
MANGDRWCFAWAPDRKASPGTDRAALLTATRWDRLSILTVSFLDGDEEVQRKVAHYAKEWTAPGLADLTLSFRKDTTDTLIRISFQYRGSWSMLGTSCRQITNLTQPTMNLGWLTRETPEEEVRRVVLHEFGHALGLIHEHQNPKGGIRWDRDRVTQDLSGPPNNWTPEQIEFNIFKPFEEKEVLATPVDDDSIMMYPIPELWTTNGFSAGLNANLSDLDKHLIREAYSS